MNNKIKEEVIEWIAKPENENLLETLRLIKQASESKDWFDTLSDTEKQSLKKGQKDHREEKTLTSKQFWQEHA